MSNNSSEFCQKLSSRKASYNRKSSLMCKEAHNHRPSLEIEMKNGANLRRGKSSSLVVSHLFKTNNIISRKSDVGKCIHNIGCQMNNRNKPRLVNLTKKRRLSNAANILFEFLFLTLLIFALITDSYISCNNMHKTIDRQPIKLGSQKHETPNPFLRALLTTASNQQFTHINPNMGRSYNNNNNNNNNHINEFMPRKMPLNNHINSNSNNNNQLVNQMMVNQPLPHINHQNMGTSESNSYNSITNLQDYPDNRGGQQNGGNNNNNEQNNNPESNLGQNGLPPPLPPPPPNSANHLVNDELRNGFNEYQQNNDQQMVNSPFEPPPNSSSLRNSNNNGGNHDQNQNQLNDQSTNSRSSNSDAYSRVVEQIKPRESSGGSTNSHNPLRSSVGDPFEDISNSGISTSEYERDLADLDEEFNRHTTSYRRPTVSGPPIVSDSFMSLSPERYEARRYNRRPPPQSYDYSGEYLNTAGSISSIVPRTYQRPPPPPHWSTSYSDNTDLWTDSNVDFSPLSSYISPSQYSYRWRPRYQRLSAYPSAAAAAAHPYLTASASEQQHLHPGYNMIPTGYTSPQVPTETISIALSPLAAAAAAAASALAAADKSRHQNHHHWLTLPRITTTTSSATANPTQTTSASASNTHHNQAIPPSAFQTAYYHHHHHHRPNPYALSSMPIYAIAPRPTAPMGPSHPTGAAAAASYIPYFHGGAPAIIAYRPTSVMPPASLLTAASFAYPLRLPVTTIPKAPTIGMTLSPTRGSSNAFRPFYSDLQYAESKSKTNLNNNNNSNNNNNNNNNSSEGNGGGKGGGLVKGGTLTAMAKNLTRKMFGSSSQIRPQHVAPPSNLNNSPTTTTYDLFSPTHNSSSSSSNVGSALTI